MCTLTWWRGEEDEFDVFFNRDEKKTRSRAELPREHQENGVRFLSPRDPDGGGTWMLANEYGVVLCLLNRWHEEADVVEQKVWKSRGQLVWELAGVTSVQEVVDRLHELDLSSVKPFSLWAFDGWKEVGLDGTAAGVVPVERGMPVTSSSYCYEEVAAARRERFAELDACERENLKRYHGGKAHEASAYTVRMCRPDAQTMSRSHLRVKPDEIRWDYVEEPRDLVGDPMKVTVVLPRSLGN